MLFNELHLLTVNSKVQVKTNTIKEINFIFFRLFIILCDETKMFSFLKQNKNEFRHTHKYIIY
jgi:hypothetical protein